jgi:hypothetical protein
VRPARAHPFVLAIAACCVPFFGHLTEHNVPVLPQCNRGENVSLCCKSSVFSAAFRSLLRVTDGVSDVAALCPVTICHAAELTGAPRGAGCYSSAAIADGVAPGALSLPNMVPHSGSSVDEADSVGAGEEKPGAGTSGCYHITDAK